MTNAVWDYMVQETEQHFSDPQIGDRFHEMYSFWVHVVGRSGERIAVREYSPPCEVPQDGKLRLFDSIEQFKAAYGYRSETDGYWVMYCNNRATEWEPVYTFATESD